MAVRKVASKRPPDLVRDKSNERERERERESEMVRVGRGTKRQSLQHSVFPSGHPSKY